MGKRHHHRASSSLHMSPRLPPSASALRDSSASALLSPPPSPVQAPRHLDAQQALEQQQQQAYKEDSLRLLANNRSCSVLLLFELMVKVFSRLSPHSLLRASQTCSRWRRIIDACPELWRICFVRQHGQPKLPAHLYAPSDYKRILMYKMFRERPEWQGLAKNKPRKLVSLPDFCSSSWVEVDRSAAAYVTYRRAIDVGDQSAVADNNGDDVSGDAGGAQSEIRETFHIQGVSNGDHAAFSLPMYPMTYILDPLDGDDLPQEFTEYASPPVVEVEMSDNFVALTMTNAVRVYPTAPRSHPYRVDIRHDEPFSVPNQVSFQKDVLVVSWVMPFAWRAEHAAELAPHPDGEMSVVSVYNFQGFWPAFATDRFTVFSHTAVPYREVFSPYASYVHSVVDYSLQPQYHMTERLADEHRQFLQEHPDREPFIKVSLGNQESSNDEGTSLPYGHRMIVFAFDRQLRLVGVRKYEHRCRPNSTLWHAEPLSRGWISVHGNYLVDYVDSYWFDASSAQPRLAIHLEDSHSAPLPDVDALDAITDVKLSNWARAIDAFRIAVPAVTPNTILRVPCHKLPHPISWLHLLGHHVVLKEQTRTHRLVKVYDVHTWDLVAARSTPMDDWHWDNEHNDTYLDPGAVARIRLGSTGVYYIRVSPSGNDSSSRRTYHLEHIPYAVSPSSSSSSLASSAESTPPATPTPPPRAHAFKSPSQLTYTRLVKPLGGKPGQRRRTRQRARSTHDYGVDEFDDVFSDDEHPLV
ncbi:hypothetical protein RI367_008148 [Sorochytrium milnesiophthora]